jgi:prevent-host-death family protein
MSALWKLEDAKARFSEVVRKAQTEGVQRVTVRGKEAVAIISVDELDRLLGARTPPVPLVQFMESLSLDGLNLERPDDRGRDVEL